MIIRLENITKHYTMGVEQIRALDGVNLEVDRNEYVAVMGTSGSGKSTLMNILGCLDRPTSGTYELDGQLTTKMGAAALAKVRNERIGFVFQSFELMPRLSALKNVELPLLYSRTGWFGRSARAKRALETVGLKERMKHRPNQLSGGQKQRVAIARALIARPAILLADEPTGNLDSRTSEEILALFDELHRSGQTIIMVTHEADVARHARRIIRMKDGKVHSDLPSDRDASSEEQKKSHSEENRSRHTIDTEERSHEAIGAEARKTNARNRQKNISPLFPSCLRAFVPSAPLVPPSLRPSVPPPSPRAFLPRFDFAQYRSCLSFPSCLRAFVPSCLSSPSCLLFPRSFVPSLSNVPRT
jgi:putative ABC transport system ATP-binding protein